MMRLTSLVPSLALLVLSACAAGSGSDTEPGFTDVQGAGGSDAAGSGGASAGTGGASGKGGASAGASGASAGSSGSTAGGASGEGGAGAGGTTGGTAGTGAAGAGAGTAGTGAGTAGTGAGTAGQGGKGGSAGAAGTGGAGGKSGMAGMAGAAGGALDCKDPEPEPKNDSELFATPACSPAPCEITDEDDTGSVGYKGSHPSLTGIVSPDDVDFYKYHGQDKTHINPTVTTNPTAKTSDGGLRICIYTACKEETKDFKCTSSGATVVKSSNGLQGCCLEGPGEVSSDHDCAGSFTDDDSADVFIEVGAIDEVCTPYAVDFHF